MSDNNLKMPSPSPRERRLWESAVRLSAGILVRDYRERAHDEAISYAELADDENNILAQAFWSDVAEELEPRFVRRMHQLEPVSRP